MGVNSDTPTGKEMQSFLVFLLFGTGMHCQRVNFGGSSSNSNRGSSSNSNRGSSSSNSENSQSTDQRILGIIPGLSTGNENTDSLINGAVGAGLVAGAGAIASALNPCRRKRQSDGVNTKLFGLFGGNSNCGNSISNSNNQCSCECKSGLTFYHEGQNYGDCRTQDHTGRYWCYTTGHNNQCGDLQSSQRFPNNPWSYNACSRTYQCLFKQGLQGATKWGQILRLRVQQRKKEEADQVL